MPTALLSFPSFWLSLCIKNNNQLYARLPMPKTTLNPYTHNSFRYLQPCRHTHGLRPGLSFRLLSSISIPVWCNHFKSRFLHTNKSNAATALVWSTAALVLLRLYLAQMIPIVRPSFEPAIASARCKLASYLSVRRSILKKWRRLTSLLFLQCCVYKILRISDALDLIMSL